MLGEISRIAVVGSHFIFVSDMERNVADRGWFFMHVGTWRGMALVSIWSVAFGGCAVDR